jgi:hypothetical protein
MIDMFLPHILNPKVVDNQREENRAGEMPPQTRCMFTLVISMGEELFEEEFIRQDTCLGRPQTARRSSMYTNPFFMCFSKLYCSLVQDGKRENGIFMYLNLSSGAIK